MVSANPPVSDELAGLVQGMARGDRSALSSLYHRTSAKLFGICVRLLGSEAEAEEVLQDVYVTVWRKAGQYDPGRGRAMTWLSLIARSRTLDRLRLRRMTTEPIEAAQDVADERPLAFELAEQAEDRARLDHCLSELDERQQAMIRSAFLDGSTYPELAEREAVPLGTVKSWVRRGLLRLRSCLGQ